MSNSSLSLSDANMEISIGIKCPYRAASQEAVRHVRFLCSQDKIRSWIRKKYSKSDPIPVQHFFFTGLLDVHHWIGTSLRGAMLK